MLYKELIVNLKLNLNFFKFSQLKILIKFKLLGKLIRLIQEKIYSMKKFLIKNI